jgi:molybdopterin/thiamine biosynthesis adenylyltransferase/rhodanese-related sulfurtransferase
MNLTIEEEKRYARHINLPEVGLEGQVKIKSAKVLCVGAGGLGSPIISYLTAAGVGTLGIIDDDVVDLSNLQRQIIHNPAQIGQPKVLSAAQWIKDNNPHVNVITYQEKLTTENALDIISQFDITIDCTDNFVSRYLINDACFFVNKPNIQASILRFDGQVAIYGMENGPCYRCLFPEIPPQNAVPNCAEGGVFGVLPGLLGIIQATEALKLIIGFGETLMNRLLCVNTLTMEFNTFVLSRNPECALCGDNPSIKNLKPSIQKNETIDVISLANELKHNPNLLLVDVREPFELLKTQPIANAINIPLNSIPDHIEQFPRDEVFVVYCKSGMRSEYAVTFLRNQGFNCQNLIGGIDAWWEKT